MTYLDSAVSISSLMVLTSTSSLFMLLCSCRAVESYWLFLENRQVKMQLQGRLVVMSIQSKKGGCSTAAGPEIRREGQYERVQVAISR
jgi:hypothetical protein